MRLLVLSEAGADPRRQRLARLPVTCCTGAGGPSQPAEILSAAWVLFYQAAHLMDSVQDGDLPQLPGVEYTAGELLSIASGLYFSANLLLAELLELPGSELAARQISQDFYRRFLVMSSGQHADLLAPQPALAEFWRLAEAKSGAFFALACTGGARLAGASAERLRACEDFGLHLGVIIQVADDLSEVKPPESGGDYGQRPGLRRSLPVLYALEVLPAEEKKQLQHLLELAPADPAAASQALAVLDGCRAGAYVSLELERRRSLAHSAIQAAELLPAAAEELSTLLDMF